MLIPLHHAAEMWPLQPFPTLPASQGQVRHAMRHQPEPNDLVQADHFVTGPRGPALVRAPWPVACHRAAKDFCNGEWTRTGGPYTSYMLEVQHRQTSILLSDRDFAARLAARNEGRVCLMGAG